MLRLLTIIAILFVNIIAMAQAPSKMSYQAVIRSNNALVVSTQIGMRVSIIKDSATGIIVYQETYNPQPTTNANGLVSVEIGGGNPSFSLFDNIDWSASTYFVKIETDVTGGTNYTNIGVSQFLSVPYALNAKSSSMVTGIVPVSNGGTGVTNVNNIKSLLGIDSLNNTPDLLKPISIATQNALNYKLNKSDTTSLSSRIAEKLSKSDTLSLSTRINSKAPINNPVFTGTVSGITKTMVGLNNVDNTTDATKPISVATQNALNNKLNKSDTTSLSSRIAEKLSKSDTISISTRINSKAPTNNPVFTGTVSGITKTMVGLNNVDNTADATKPISVATQNAINNKLSKSDTISISTRINSKAPINNPVFTGTVSGITKTMVGLNNVDNTTDVAKPVSVLMQVELNKKAQIDSPAFNGKITADRIGVGTTSMENSAKLEVNSTYSGFLPPRMTFQQRNWIANPAMGLMIYCINCGAYGEMQVFNGTSWVNMIGGASIGPVPNAPLNPIAIAGEAQATISFISPTPNGASAITGYVVTSTPGGIAGSGTNSPIIVTGLNNGTTYTFKVVAINSSGSSLPSVVSNGITPIGSSFVSGTPITFLYNGVSVTYGTVTSAGKIWLDRNLGASQVATSSTDVTSYGDLFQWGRGSDGHQIITSTTTNILSLGDAPGNASFILATYPYDWRISPNNNLWQGITGINNPCPFGFRIPNTSELIAERLSWSSNNSSGGFASPLKLTMAGFRNIGDGYLGNVGNRGLYWSSTTNGNTGSQGLDFVSNGAGIGAFNRGLGFSVRCICNLP